MTLSAFPDFQEIDLSHCREIKDLLQAFPLEASEYTFSNLYAFRKTYNFKVARLDDALIILKDVEPVSFFCPVGKVKYPLTVEEIFRWLKEVKGTASMERVPESVASVFMNNEEYLMEEERDHFDYIYSVQELSKLSGRKYHDKRNKVNKFRTSYTYEYLPLTVDLVDDCLDFEDQWCEVKECVKYYGLEKERDAILQLLLNFDVLSVKGGAIRIKDKIEALTLGEKLLDDTFVIHIEKANTDIPGLYQVINQEFLMHEAQDFTYVNREQDLGIPGLRKSKMSYNPARLGKKFRITVKQ